MQPTQDDLARLRALGWPDDDTAREALAAASGHRLARVASQHRTAYDVATGPDEMQMKVQPPIPWTIFPFATIGPLELPRPSGIS